MRRVRRFAALLHLHQPSIDLLGTEVRKGWIHQHPGGQDYLTGQQNWVDGIVGRLVPQLRLPLTAPAMMRKRAMKNLVGQHSFEFGRLEPLDKGRAVNDPATVGRHRRNRSRHELQAYAQRSEERMIEQELRSRPDQLLLRRQMPAHAATGPAGTAG